MDVKVNIVELASELAVEHLESSQSQHVIYEFEDEDNFKYTKLGQLMFDARYDYYYDMINKYKID